MDLSSGFNTFVKHDDSQDEHLDSLLKAIVLHEKETGAKIDANIVTWRGMMTKVKRLHKPSSALPLSKCQQHFRTNYSIDIGRAV